MRVGANGADFFTARRIAVEAVARDDYDMWLPAECPLCAAGLPLESPTA